jgi:GWxTD domain-containing protein
MAPSAISRLINAFALAVFSLATFAQCNLDKQTPTSHSGSQYPSPSPNYAAWLNQDVRWIITDEERAAFKRLRSDEEREQFIQQFWLRRDPTPGTFLNEFKQEHYRRMLYANGHFATAATPGWRTDRGRIYILYGKPDQVTAENGTVERSEIWKYR